MESYIAEFVVGDRVIHPTMPGWGVGQLIAVKPPNILIYFEVAGEKKLRADMVELRKVVGTESASTLLDKKFEGKRKRGAPSELGENLFNRGRKASRKKFIESLGATCSNWTWSWSFINENEKKIFFGAWQDFVKGDRALIFSKDWEMRRGKKQSPWPESRENVRRIEEEGYSLYVYTMILDSDSDSEFEKGPRKIGAILNDVTQAKLLREGDEWFALFPEVGT
jgi:hypothetical protein